MFPLSQKSVFVKAGPVSMLKKVFPIITFSLVFVTIVTNLFAQSRSSQLDREAWVDSVFNTMGRDQKLGQLFMVAAYSNKDSNHANFIEKLIRDNAIGGLIFMQGGPLRQARLNNRFQAAAKVPLMISIDGEWGLNMRLDSTIAFPKQMTLGAIQDEQRIYKMGAEIGRQCKRIGIHVNFAPVIDINSNANNPVIGYRSFGEEKKKVTAYGTAYMRGLQDNRVLACAKHFPGHGDTDTDSHMALPAVNHSRKRLDSVELYPFKKLIKDSVASVLVAHMFIPSLDTIKRASTLSRAIVTDLLKVKLGFKGLIFTDALNMKGVSKFFKPGEVDLLALKAGNDVLLFSEDVPTAIFAIKRALADGSLDSNQVYGSVKKILSAKYWAGLSNYKPVELANLYEDLNNGMAKALRQELYEKAITLVKNSDKILPIRELNKEGYASLCINIVNDNVFQPTLSKYACFDHYLTTYNAKSIDYDTLINKLSRKSTVIVSLNGLAAKPVNNNNYGISDNVFRLISALQQRTNVIVVVFGTAYSLKHFDLVKTLICAYEDNYTVHKAVAAAIFGAAKFEGKLPVSVSPKLCEGTGELTVSLKRLRYTSVPEMEKMDSRILNKIDTVALKSIFNKATPGCQILVVRNGNVIFERNYGNLKYDKTEPVTSETIYDVASVTKVAATLQGLMKLYDEGLFHTDSLAITYLPELKKSNKKSLLIQEILLHQAGLPAFVEYWKRTLDSSGHPSEKFYCNESDNNFNYEVAPGLYAGKFLRDSLWKWTIQSNMPAFKEPCPPYRYSDVGFIMMNKTIERISGLPENEFMAPMYESLGMYNTGFNPLNRFPINRIAPTEVDNYFRHREIRGTVHDQGAAMFGGVAGHAGLFSTANDLAILFQMNLQDGEYGGQQYYNSGVVTEFARRHFTDSRRGLGWDKPVVYGSEGPTSNYCSLKTFGHTGFTGTCVWADPKYNLIYIFLSNRTYPNADNKKLVSQNVRTKIQDIIYESMTDRK